VRQASAGSSRGLAAGRSRAILSLAALLVAMIPAPVHAKKGSIAPGRERFRQFCVPCHGEAGTGGGMGPSIVTQKSLELTNRDLFETIRSGRVKLGMPTFGMVFRPRQIQGLIAYVRALQGVEVEIGGPLEATPAARPKAELERIARGRGLFVGRARCFDCHSIFNDGGMVAPDLTKIGKRMRRRRIRASIVHPSRRIAPGFGAKEIVTKGGRTIRGWYRHETPETIQIFDPDENLWTTYFKRELRSVRASPESLMPADLLDPLSEEERRDLMAFLASLE
jgi:putative heme-binding domain-containing protein